MGNVGRESELERQGSTELGDGLDQHIVGHVVILGVAHGDGHVLGLCCFHELCIHDAHVQHLLLLVGGDDSPKGKPGRRFHTSVTFVTRTM